SSSARGTGRQSVPRTTPLTTSRRPRISGSSSEARSGELGLKYGPSVCTGVAPCSPHAGLGASGGCAGARAPSAPAAETPSTTPRNSRREGVTTAPLHARGLAEARVLGTVGQGGVAVRRDPLGVVLRALDVVLPDLARQLVEDLDPVAVGILDVHAVRHAVV